VALVRLGLAMTDLDVLLELPSNEAVLTAVEAGGGAAVLSRHVVAAALQSGALVALDFPLPKRRFFRLRHKERHMTQAEAALYRMIGGASTEAG
jgi:DNA-binding transcriptional LysR family regulator